MPNTENTATAIAMHRTEGTITLDPAAQHLCWRNSDGGRVSRYFASVAEALRFCPS